MKDFSGGDTENSTMKAGKTNMGRLSKVEISGVNTSKLPVLSREEAKVLFQQARAGSEEARQTLIQGNLRLVLSVIKKFDGRNENPDDLFQVGCVGLIKGIDNFNVDLDVFPSTYLVPMIVGEIRRYLRTTALSGCPALCGIPRIRSCRPKRNMWRNTSESPVWRRLPNFWT